MNLSTKTRYATRAIVEIARNYEKRCVSVKEISVKQNISMKYLENIMSKLKNCNLVISRRGAGGGYVLAKDPAEIRLIDIYNATEDKNSPVECVMDPRACPKSSKCIFNDLWTEMKTVIDDFMSGINLNDILKKMEDADQHEK